MSNVKRSGFGRGVLVGAAMAGASALLVAAGASSEPSYHVTSSADGRIAHLWSRGGGELTYLSSAEMPKGKSDGKASKEKEADDAAAADPREAKPEKVEPQKARPKGKPGGG